ncbi:SIR2 family protein [Blastococcus sp. SYSU DS1024]
MPEHEHHDVDGNECIHCALDLDFDLPAEIVEAAHNRNLVVFAGAGISTEVSLVFPSTVLELAAHRLGIEKPDSFPETMQAFQDRFSRQELVRMIKTKFDYIDSFPSLRIKARDFHHELATMPYIRDVVTTNWDTYFEEVCLATPFVTGEDVALYNMPGRRVLKVHGTITNLSSLVATETDYTRNLEALGGNVMGGLLRQLLATKTVVFVGYSLSDWNFRRLYEALRKDMKDYAPRAYAVSPFDSPGAADLGLTLLRTSGVEFLRRLKRAMLGHCFIADERYDDIERVADALDEANRVAKSVSHKEFPAVIFCWAYHDGFRDACFRITMRRGSGEYSDLHRVTWQAQQYEAAYERAFDAGRFADAAYIDGYCNGLTLMLGDEDDDLAGTVPLYFVFGADSAMRTEQEFREALVQSRRRAPRARAKAKELSAGLAEGMVLTHAPFLPDFPEGSSL